MRALLQRVAFASVSVQGEEVARIGRGLLVFLGIAREDTEEDARYLVEKVVHLRIFEGEGGRMERSLLEVGGSLLVVSQFTLYAETRRGRRPSFVRSAPPETARPLYERTVDLFRRTGVPVQTGRFQERMEVRLLNDGPVTLLLDSADRHRPRSSA